MTSTMVNPFDALRLLRAGPFDGFDRLTAGALRLLRAGPFDGFDAFDGLSTGRLTAGALRLLRAGPGWDERDGVVRLATKMDLG
jgi:hypothetical protein